MNLSSYISRLFFCLLAVLLLPSCEESYYPEVLEQPNNFLVVIGSISSNSLTVIKLTRTQSITDTNNPIPETRATVIVEQENGPSFPLPESEPGTYASVNILPLNPAKKYRLTILAAGKKYGSAFVEVKKTKVIENLRWKAEDDGLEIFVNTRDPQNETRYYRWVYEETWEYTAPYRSWYEFVNGAIQDRAPENDIYFCWRSQNSTKIHITNTITLGEDVVSEFPLVKLPVNSDKLRWKYSLLVKQYAETKESYQYWVDLKQNTEKIGSLYDPLPTQLTGNIICLSNPSEPVIGFISADSVEEKRIFIKKSELPINWRAFTMSCDLDTIRFKDVEKVFSSKSFLPTTMAFNEAGAVIGYLGSTVACVDCRVFGTKTRPPFWE